MLGLMGVSTLGLTLLHALCCGERWLVSGLALVGLALLSGAWSTRHLRLTAHEKEMLAWEAEFPGLPWYMDDVKDSRQLDLWERARDYWEQSHYTK